MKKLLLCLLFVGVVNAGEIKSPKIGMYKAGDVSACKVLVKLRVSAYFNSEQARDYVSKFLIDGDSRQRKYAGEMSYGVKKWDIDTTKGRHFSNQQAKMYFNSQCLASIK